MIHEWVESAQGDSFRSIFFQEALEHLDNIEALQLRLDVREPSTEDLNAIFRAVHSIKGSASMLGFDEIASLTHLMESLLDLLRGRARPVAKEDIDTMLKAGDAIRAHVDHRRGQLDTPPESADAAALLHARLRQTESADAHGNARRRRFSVRLGPLAEPIDSQLLDTALAGLAEVGELGHQSLQNVPGGMVAFDVALEGTEGDLREVLRLVIAPDRISVEAHHGAAAPASARPSPIVAGHGEELFVDPAEFKARRLSSPVPATDASSSSNEESANELIGMRSTARMPNGTAGAHATAAPNSPPRKVEGDGSSIRVATDKIDLLVTLVGELIITESMLSRQASLGQAHGKQGGSSGLADLARHTRDLQEAVLAIRMVPIANVFARFPRVVRALAEQLDKRVELRTLGEETELDRGLIELISDPLMHLIRNAIDHGIETPDERIAAGKRAEGTLSLAASQRGGKVVIEVTDDGRGLNRERILARARERSLPIADDAPDTDVWQLVFHPGFTTATEVTDVSGRGVGMDVVLRNILALGGTVDLASSPGGGTKVTVSIPLTLAIINGLLVGVGGATYVIPLDAVVECLDLEGEDQAAVRRSGHVNLRSKVLPVVRLRDAFEITSATGKRENVVVVSYGQQKAGLVVDALLGEFQTVIKPLGRLFERLAGISGSTILGSGEVALILDVPHLIQRCGAAHVA